MAELVQPSVEQVLEFCSHDPVERVFLEDVARRGLGRFRAVADGDRVRGLCYVGANVVPSGEECGAFASVATNSAPLMIIGDETAVGDLWEEASRSLPEPCEDRRGQPVFALSDPPPAAGTELREATLDDLDLLVPACAEHHLEEIGEDPLRADASGYRARTRSQIESGRSWLWRDGDTILFKAEASAWTPSAVQLQQVWVDPPARRQGYGERGMRDLCRLLLERADAVCLFVRTENEPAIRLYESIGMERAGTYRTLLF